MAINVQHFKQGIKESVKEDVIDDSVVVADFVVHFPKVQPANEGFMAKQRNYRLIFVSFAVALVLLTGCQPRIVGTPVNLEPNDPRPILSLQVEDADEATLLVQQIGLEIVRMEGLTVYFFEDADQSPRLVDLGYDLEQQNPYNVFRRVVRIDRAIPETELAAGGLQIINREEQYLVVEGAIGQLRALERSGSRIVAISGHEPRPRQIRVIVANTEDVAKIGAMQVDIYSAKPELDTSMDSKRADRDVAIVIYGAAFDYQIDQLRNADYDVEVLP